MLRIRTAVVSTIAVFALTGLAQAAPASAHEYKVEGSPVTAYANVGAGSKTDLEIQGTPFGIRVVMACTQLQATGGLEAGGLSTLDAAYTGCEVRKPANCTLSGVTLGLGGELESVGTSLEDKFAVSSGWTFQGPACSLKAKPVELKGTQMCSLPAVSTESEEHELVCETFGSSLEMGSKPATLSDVVSDLRLVNEKGEPTHKTWSAA